MPALSHEAYPLNTLPSVNQVVSKGMSMNVLFPNQMDQKLVHLAYQHSARVQKFQIDAAIRLLQMEYETIMARMNHQSPPDRLHQEALGAVQTIAMLGSNIPKMSAQSCAQPGHRVDTRCASENGRVQDVACSSDKKRSRDEEDLIEREQEEPAHPSGHGKLVLTCEVFAACCCYLVLWHKLTFLLFSDCM